eukprot:1357156-Amorphochlora_amoeboformis.AAC.1
MRRWTGIDSLERDSLERRREKRARGERDRKIQTVLIHVIKIGICCRREIEAQGVKMEMGLLTIMTYEGDYYIMEFS